MTGGYHNRIGWIDLSAGTIAVKPMAAGDTEAFIGGGGIGAAMLARLVSGHTDPLGPDNPIIMMTGPFTGTLVPAGLRYQVVTLSPLSGAYGEANCGGAFGQSLKACGLDGLVFTGRAATPVYLVVEDGDLRLEDAADLWGQEVYDGDAALKERHGKKVVNAMIGPAGERLVAFSSIAHDGKHTRFAGRCGVGAVMGSKQLKAICVSTKGKQKTPIVEAEAFRKATMAFIPEIQETLEGFRKYGTGQGAVSCHEVGNLPINNWRSAQDRPLAEKTSGLVVARDYQLRRRGCKRCAILCSRGVEIKDGPYKTEGEISGPEYETLAGLGSLLGNDNLESIIKANERCNQLGIDTISAGQIIAFAFECYEQGVITAADTGGLELEFGDETAILALIEKLGRPDDDFSRALAQGSRKAAAIFGGTAADYALEVKGLELPMHDPRYSWGQGLSYATSNRGACHLAAMMGDFENGCTVPELGYTVSKSGYFRDGKAHTTAMMQNLMCVLDSLVICKFTVIADATSFGRMAEWYSMITGRATTVEDFNAIGKRIFTLKRMINNRCGITRKDDTLPPRMRTLRKTGGGIDLKVPPIDDLLADYYDIRGWTADGAPDAATVTRTGLEGYTA